jgi:hypothetical protein
MWKWIKENDKPLQILLAFALAIGGSVEYFNRRAQAAVETTLKFIEAYQKPETLASWSRESTYWERDGAKYATAGTEQAWAQNALCLLNAGERYRKDAAPDTSEVRKDCAGIPAAPSVAEANLFEDVTVLQNFFQSVAICANAEICDPTATCAFFGEKIDAFYKMYGKYLAEKAAQRHSLLSDDMAIFVKSTCADEFRRLTSRSTP